MSAATLHPALRRSMFLAGTDTGVGKTVVACWLLRELAASGSRVAGMKPVAAGARATAGGLRNEDALALAAAGSVGLPYDWINPYCLPEATAPHLAAQAVGVRIDPVLIVSIYRNISSKCELVIVEGAGGWLAPIGPAGPDGAGGTMQDVALALGLPVVLVVGIRLGCISHALLTEAAIARSGLAFAGWIANPVDPGFADADRYVETLSARLSAPLLARTPRVILPGQ